MEIIAWIVLGLLALMFGAFFLSGIAYALMCAGYIIMGVGFILEILFTPIVDLYKLITRYHSTP
ncbi:hypothetical protein [Pasteurella bettyae]|uniref:Uncharacterized protein n=1 Tax=Pasteurella bettyae CCUG 2042 TaxID=1095749 RepID=I3DCC9_9PAST|nr:hypothetical protein [Pasteurella bettyae]EIJ69372.1 hypothetical protein HMPREF1052_0848 [Pasteurella bettyae CCUG 2042]SUB20761.1 Uncharacterised protein [Pasteurella bettyae]SUB21317.1 Uncharacterised protein [Pasteurella bettyae]